MLKKFMIIGLATALIGCGTSNKALADTNIFTQAPEVDYDSIFNERSVVMGLLHLMKIVVNR